VLVTGGAGFIGSHIASRLVQLGAQVRIVDNLSTGRRSNIAAIPGTVDFVVGDLRDRAVADRVTRDIDLVYHVAALPSVPRSLADPIASHECNVTATLNVLEACRTAGVRRVVYSSSSSVYGDTPVLPKVESMEPLPRSPYATSKLGGEQYVLAYARAGLVEGVALRYFNVFGPRQDPEGPYAAVIPKLLRAALDAQTMTINGDGLQTRDFTHVDNVVHANLLAGTRPARDVNGWVVNCGSGDRTSLLDLVGLAERVSGRPIAIEHLPPRLGDVRDSLAGQERAKTVRGYVPSVSLAQGLEQTWKWFVDDEAKVATGA
jgi:UDP-glucose 4-epimerase